MDPDEEVMAVTGMFLMMGKGLVVQLAHLLYMGLCALSPKRDCALYCPSGFYALCIFSL